MKPHKALPNDDEGLDGDGLLLSSDVRYENDLLEGKSWLMLPTFKNFLSFYILQAM
jgi:hypothetical protein